MTNENVQNNNANQDLANLTKHSNIGVGRFRILGGGGGGARFRIFFFLGGGGRKFSAGT